MSGRLGAWVATAACPRPSLGYAESSELSGLIGAFTIAQAAHLPPMDDFNVFYAETIQNGN